MLYVMSQRLSTPTAFICYCIRVVVTNSSESKVNLCFWKFLGSRDLFGNPALVHILYCFQGLCTPCYTSPLMRNCVESLLFLSLSHKSQVLAVKERKVWRVLTHNQSL